MSLSLRQLHLVMLHLLNLRVLCRLNLLLHRHRIRSSRTKLHDVLKRGNVCAVQLLLLHVAGSLQQGVFDGVLLAIARLLPPVLHERSSALDLHATMIPMTVSGPEWGAMVWWCAPFGPRVGWWRIRFKK